MWRKNKLFLPFQEVVFEQSSAPTLLQKLEIWGLPSLIAFQMMVLRSLRKTFLGPASKRLLSFSRFTYISKESERTCNYKISKVNALRKRWWGGGCWFPYFQQEDSSLLFLNLHLPLYHDWGGVVGCWQPQESMLLFTPTLAFNAERRLWWPRNHNISALTCITPLNSPLTLKIMTEKEKKKGKASHRWVSFSISLLFSEWKVESVSRIWAYQELK